MADNDSILGSLGTIAFWSTVGVAGKEGYKHFKSVKSAMETMKTSPGESTSRGVKMPSNFDKFTATTKNGFSNFTQSVGHAQPIDEVGYEGLAQMFGDTPANLKKRISALESKLGTAKYTSFGGRPYELFFDNKSFGLIPGTDGKIVTANSLSSSSAFSSRTLHSKKYAKYEFFDDIKANAHMSSQQVVNSIESNIVSQPMAKLIALEKNLSTGTRDSISKDFYDIVGRFNNDLLENPSYFQGEIYRNSFEPMVFYEGKDMKLSAFDTSPGGPSDLIDNAIRKINGKKVINPIFGASKTNITNSTYVRPAGVSPEVRKMYNLMNKISGKITPDHKLNQFLSRAASFDNPSYFAHSDLRELQAMNGINIAPINSVFIPEGDPVFQKMLKGGRFPVSDIDGEGFFMSDALANKRMSIADSIFVPMGEGNYASKELDQLLNYMVTTTVGSDKKFSRYTKSFQEMNLGGMDMEDFGSYLRPGSKVQHTGQIKDYERARNFIFDDAVRNGHLANALTEAPHTHSSNTIFQKLFGRKGIDLTTGETGTTSWSRHKNMTIENVSFEKGGIRFMGSSKYRFKDSMAKVWGTIKAIGLRQLGTGHMQQLVFQNLALQKKFGQDSAGKLAFMNGTGWSSQLRGEYPELYKSVSTNKDWIITHQTPSKTAMQKATGKAEYDIFGDIVKAESEAYIKSNPVYEGLIASVADKHESTGILRQAISLDKHSHEYGQGNMANVNDIIGNRLSGSELESASRFIENMYDKAGLKNVVESYAPMLAGSALPKDNFVFQSDMLNDKNIERLFTSNVEDTLRLAKELANKKTVSDKTRFFIQVNHETTNGMVMRNIAIPTFNSGYTSVMNQDTHLLENGEPLLKKLNASSLRYINSVRNGSYDKADRAWTNLYEDAASVFDFKNFTNVASTSATVSGAKDSLLLSDAAMSDLIDRKMISQERLASILDEHGLSYGNIDKSYAVGMSGNDYQKFSGHFSDADKVNGLLKKEASWMIGGRDPGFVHQGFTMHQGIDMSRLSRQIAGEMDDKHGASRWLGYMSKNIADGEVRLSKRSTAATAVDWDRDPFKMIAFTDPKLRNAAVTEFETANEEVFDFMQGIYGQKGGIKNDSKVSESDLLEMFKMEKQSIGPTYVRAQSYTAPFNNFENVLSDVNLPAWGGTVTAKKKSAILNHIFAKMSEEAIQSKNMDSAESLQQIKEMLEGRDAARSAELFKQRYSGMTGYVQKDGRWIEDESRKVMDLLSQDELTAVFKRGHSYSDEIVTGITRGVHSGNIASFIRHMLSNGIRGAAGTDVGSKSYSHAFAELNMQSPVKIGLNTIGDASAEILPKILKNKWVRGLAATSLLAGFVMRGPQDHIQSQDAREESRPKNRLSGSDPIDPPGARVYQPSVGGYNVNIRGNTPRGIGAAQIGSQLQQMGMPVRNTFIDRNSSIDAHHIKSIQDEDRSNKWNG